MLHDQDRKCGISSFDFQPSRIEPEWKADLPVDLWIFLFEFGSIGFRNLEGTVDNDQIKPLSANRITMVKQMTFQTFIQVPDQGSLNRPLRTDSSFKDWQIVNTFCVNGINWVKLIWPDFDVHLELKSVPCIWCFSSFLSFHRYFVFSFHNNLFKTFFLTFFH